jgi:hypothetical protein
MIALSLSGHVCKFVGGRSERWNAEVEAGRASEGVLG